MDAKTIKRNSTKIFLLCFFAYASIYVGRKNFGACMNAMIGDGVLTETFGGAILTAFLAAYATGQLVNGLLGDRFPQRYMISIGLMGAGCVNVLMGLNSIPWLFLVLWCMCGIFCSMLWSAVIRCISEWIPDEHRTSAGTNLSPSIPVGSIASYLICALVLKIADWRIAFITCGCFLIFASLFFFTSVGRMRPFIEKMQQQNRAAIVSKPEKKSADSPAPSKLNIIAIIFTFGVTFALIGILFNGILKDALESWVPTYITSCFGATESLSSLLSSMLPIVGLVGVYFAKFLYTRFLGQNEMLTSGVMFAISAVLMLPVVFITAFNLTSPVLMIIVVLLLASVISLMLGINTLYLTYIPLCFGKIGRAASVTGFLNAFSYAAAALSGLAIGVISQSFGWTVTIVVFTASAALGAVAGFSGTGMWKRGKEKLENLPTASKEETADE